MILAIATPATLRGTTSLVAIGEVAAELPEEPLRRLSCAISPARKAYVAPEESTIRRTLNAIGANAVDLVVNAWIADQVRAGRLTAEQAPLVELAAMLERETGLWRVSGDFLIPRRSDQDLLWISRRFQAGSRWLVSFAGVNARDPVAAERELHIGNSLPGAIDDPGRG